MIRSELSRSKAKVAVNANHQQQVASIKDKMLLAKLEALFSHRRDLRNAKPHHKAKLVLNGTAYLGTVAQFQEAFSLMNKPVGAPSEFVRRQAGAMIKVEMIKQTFAS